MYKYLSFLCLLPGLLFMIVQDSHAQSNPLPIESDAPAFKAKASLAGEAFMFSLEEALADGPVVVYFYPAAYTGGCDLEARTFSNHIDKFKAANTTIVGVSADSIQRLNRFSADPELCAGNFAVASDPEGKIASTYGLEIIPPKPDMTDANGDPIDHGFIPRTTFVINEAGEIVAVFSSKRDQLSPVEHVTKSLDIVQGLQSNKTG